MGIGERLSGWLAHAEVLARGAEHHRAAATEALAAGRLSEARSHALELVEELPRSPVALALWADAASAMGLHEELEQALERLTEVVPHRQEPWLQLASVRRAQGKEPRAALERALCARGDVGATDRALLQLATLDLSAGDARRAERGVLELSPDAQRWPETQRLRLAVALELGDEERFQELIAQLPLGSPADDWEALVRARAVAPSSPDAAVPWLVRALLLGSRRALVDAAALVRGPLSVVGCARLEAVVRDLGEQQEPLWRAALAERAGDTAAALEAIGEAHRAAPGDPSLLARHLELALAQRAVPALRDAVELGRRAAPEQLPPGVEALGRALEPGAEEAAVLEHLDAAIGLAAPWASELRVALLGRWCQPGAVRFEALIEELRGLAWRLGSYPHLQRVEALTRELDRPLQVAVVGEFNAGKSTLINALLGEPWAPMGILPTTACLHRLRFADDRFARITFTDGARERVLAEQQVAAVLTSLAPDRVEEVALHGPLPLLQRVELLDTPGFNAHGVELGEAHARVAQRALGRADVALWVMDATQPFKASERRRLLELSELGLPVQVLLNKRDRLSPPQLEAALELVQAGLAEARLESLAPPVALSARAALQAGTTGSEAWQRSNLAEVLALFETTLAGRARELVERSFQRRALDLVEQLAAVSHQRLEAARLAQRRQAEQRERWRLALARPLDRASLPSALVEARRALNADLTLLGAGSAGLEGRVFAAQRTLERLSPALTEALLLERGLAGEAELTAALRERLEPLVAGAAVALRSEDALALPLLLELGREQLRRWLVARLREPVAAPHEPVGVRLAALREALGTPPDHQG